MIDNLGANSADSGAALAFFNSQPGNALVADAAAAGFATVVAAETGPLGEAGFELSVAPNPSTAGAAALRVTLPEASAARLSVFDVLGREVAVVANETLGAGTRTFALGAPASGRRLRRAAPDGAGRDGAPVHGRPLGYETSARAVPVNCAPATMPSGRTRQCRAERRAFVGEGPALVCVWSAFRLEAPRDLLASRAWVEIVRGASVARPACPP